MLVVSQSGRERSARELEIFAASELAQILSRRELIVHVEMPLLWAKSSDECIEGIIDLAALGSGEWPLRSPL